MPPRNSSGTYLITIQVDWFESQMVPAQIKSELAYVALRKYLPEASYTRCRAIRKIGIPPGAKLPWPDQTTELDTFPGDNTLQPRHIPG